MDSARRLEQLHAWCAELLPVSEQPTVEQELQIKFVLGCLHDSGLG